MARYTIEAPDKAPPKDEIDAMLVRLASRGLNHEEPLEQEIRTNGLAVVKVIATLQELAGESK